MDLTAPFKTEVLRPVTTLIVPGTIAVGPFVLVLGDYVPAITVFWSTHPSAFSALLVLAVLAAGFIIDDIGAQIEVLAWDRLLYKNDKNHNKNWEAYLKLQINDELVGQRYLRTKFTQLKFELAMGPSLVIFWAGLLWLQILHRMWTGAGFALVTLLLFVGASYLLWESSRTAMVLSKTRKLILEAVAEGPKGIHDKRPKSS